MLSPWCFLTAAAAAEVEGLKAALKKAEDEVAEKKAAAEKVVVELEKAKTVGEKHEARVAEVQVELKDAIMKCEDLEKKQKDQHSKLSNTTKIIHFRDDTCLS